MTCAQSFDSVRMSSASASGVVPVGILGLVLSAVMAILLSLAAAPLQGQVLIGYIFSELLTTPTFLRAYDDLVDRVLAAGQPVATWIAAPHWGRMHVPNCDLNALISRPMWWSGYTLN